MKNISLHWLQGIFETVPYYPGGRNVLADRASRLQEPGGYAELQRALAAVCWPHPVAGQCVSYHGGETVGYDCEEL